MPDSSSSRPSLKHELRTPLNHIIGYCELLIEESEDDPDIVTLLLPDLHRIHSAGRRLLGVINELFDSNLPHAERLDGVRFHHEIRTPLNQIIGYTEILLEDSADMPGRKFEDDLEKIRSAAHRLLDLITENFGSEGIPLDGSEHLDPEQSVNLLHRESTLPDADGRTYEAGDILLADDDAANREMLTRRLQRLGHTVSTARNGREVIEMIREKSYDLLLLDIFMPEMNGYEVLEHLQANPPPHSLPVIVLSASDDSDKIVRCIEIGAEDYLPKPFDPSLLQARIESSLEKGRLRDREAEYLRTIESEKKRSDDLLHVILPASVAAELKETGEVKPRRIENVSVLFADIVGFTSYCQRNTPEIIHRDLQALVNELEIISAEHGMEKIKTIGDAYLAAAGLIRPSENPTLDSVRAGLAMIRAARELPTNWLLRVGIHTGPLVAGIVGRQKYQYDIWGDTVNTASRMESSAPPGGLCVSESTWAAIADHCRGRSLGTHAIKGLGKIELFEVLEVIA